MDAIGVRCKTRLSPPSIKLVRHTAVECLPLKIIHLFPQDSCGERPFRFPIRNDHPIGDQVVCDSDRLLKTQVPLGVRPSFKLTGPSWALLGPSWGQTASWAG